MGTERDQGDTIEKLTPAVIARRQRVATLTLLEKSVAQIATELKVGTATVTRDRKWLHDNSTKWSNEQALGGFMFDCQQQLIRIEQSIQNLEAMRNDTTDDGKPLPFWQKLHLEKSIAELAAKKMEINDMVPMYHKLTNYMKKHAISQQMQN